MNQPILFVNAEEVMTKFEKKLKEFEINISHNFQPKQPTEYLTRSEVCKLLKIDQSTLHRWTKDGKINAFALGNRVYYLRTEIDEKIKNSKIN